MRTKAVFFDIGNVLLGFNWQLTFPRILDKSPLSEHELSKRFMQTRYTEYERDELTTLEFFTHLKHHLEFLGDPEELRDICTDIFFPLEQNIFLAKKLSSNYRLGIISNTNQLHADFMEKRYDFFRLFEVRIYSHKVKVRKPDQRIYDFALSSLNIHANEALFIDDLEDNVIAACKLGWKAIQLKKDTDLGMELVGCGIQF